MDNPNQFPRVDYTPVPEERRLFLEEKFKRRNLAPETLIIRPELRKLHIATLVLAFGKQPLHVFFFTKTAIMNI
ncbi:hypothetical protein BGX27_007110 [Mortierella sp. AM989]|nr:hypothetical protein BGX27_007110 [Mortierella sp. AM989]